MKRILVIFFFLFILQSLHAQWTMLNEPYETQGVRCLLNHPNGTLFAIGIDGLYDSFTIYRSTDLGTTWTKVLITDGHRLYCLDVDPQGKIYAGTVQGYYYSSDDGNTWTLNSTIPIGNVYSIAFNSLGYIFVGFSEGTDEGIYRSMDGGMYWNSVLPYYGELLIDENDNIYAATRFGIYSSSDNGSNWTILNNGLTSTNCRNIVINSFGDLFVSTENGVFKSTDNGLNWFLPDSTAVISVQYLAVGNDNSINACTWSTGIFRSQNDGYNWHYLGSGGNHTYQIYCVVVDNQNKLYAGNDRALYEYSEADSTWYLGTLYKSIASVGSLAFCSDSTIIANTQLRLWKSTNNGSTWNYINDWYTPLLTNVPNNRIFIASPYVEYSDNCGDNWLSSNIQYLHKIYIHSINELYAGYGWHFYKSTDNGNTWDELCYIFNTWCGGKTTAIAINSLGYIFYSASGNTGNPYYENCYVTYRSTDNGNSFSELFEDKDVTSMEIDWEDNVLAGTKGLGVIKSPDNGNSWSTMNDGLSDLYVNDLIFSPDSLLIAATNSGVFRFHRELQNWSKLDTSGLLSKQINSIFFHNNVLYADTTKGIAYYTGNIPVEFTSFTAEQNGGNIILNWSTASELNNREFEIERKADKGNWVLIGNKKGFGTTTVLHDYTFTDQYIFNIQTNKLYYRIKQIDYNGSYKYSTIVEIDLLPSTYSLEQNYPNPFNPTTRIKYSIPKEGNVTLKVFDALGREVATLVNKVQKAGNYTIDFDGSKLTSGVYFYRLHSGNFVETKKFLLVK
jgi:photosystem II stability/assembly factor-like uncharacterized protein